jgi:histone-lysine N-methyltransferase SUV39H
LASWERELNRAISDGKEGMPIRIENYVDLEEPAKNFTYITECKLAEGIQVDDDPPIFCTCKKTCITREDSLEAKEGEMIEEEKEVCCVETHQAKHAYKNKLLIHTAMNKRFPIFECNKNCQCGPECGNRVVQNGRKVRVILIHD